MSSPAAASSPRLLWVHGGAFVSGGLDQRESHEVALALSALGTPVTTVDYRLASTRLSRLLRGGSGPDVRYPVLADDVLAVARHELRAGPLVVAACILPPGRRGRIEGLDDSKVLTPATRERLYHQIRARALAFSVIVIPAEEIDAYGLHVANLAGMRRAIGTLTPRADYALTDGFAVPGLAVPSVGVWKGDATMACIAAASILAKVTRDAIMTDLHDQWPDYEFCRHKGYITPAHEAALTARGPCPEHRRRYVNVRRALGERVPAAVDDNEGVAVPVGETA